MGIFDFLKNKDNMKIEKIVNKNKLDIYVNAIPLNVRRLLYISEQRSMIRKNPIQHKDLIISIETSSNFEPSEIITSLPIMNSSAEPLGYYPSYYEMSSEQRYHYLLFLTNIQRNIDIGYVFVFYYGLERKIYSDDDLYEAVEMIVRLQRHHKNSSFLTYSNNALIYAAMKKKDPNILLKMNLDTLRPELLFLVKGSFIGKFNTEDLIVFAKGVGYTNDRYIKSNKDLFQRNLTDQLTNKFGSEYYVLDKSLTLDTKAKIRLVLANVSISNREFEYPNTLLNSKIQSDIYLLLKEAHNMTKKEIAKSRVAKIKTSSSFEQIKKQSPPIFIPKDGLSIRERILLSKEPIKDGFEEEMKGFEYYKQRDYEAAEEWLLRSVKGNFDAPALYEKLGVLYRKQKRFSDEVEILKIGIKNVIFNPRLNERLAKAIELNEKQKFKNKNHK
ncbi:hypothetical protein PGRAN_12199 [Listeria grandensis FSL F6-0971]|uniref:TerB N-terminal domain-containing protein n=1 Tax=Listeria grandensis FSL F6-0971 TaxID=1265819 RepID=W7BD28_9LIST|nr:TerB N-terminal domain-containing protein [Listeria grandensis]EUJ22710.1 hypothetical protein PGRAN_12199 [Listeria grandensis FSL F6-0971]